MAEADVSAYHPNKKGGSRNKGRCNGGNNGKGSYRLIDQLEALEGAMSKLWKVALKITQEFVRDYQPYFEKALDEDLHAPNYAFCKGCFAAGLPLDKWAKRYVNELNYSLGYRARAA